MSPNATLPPPLPPQPGAPAGPFGPGTPPLPGGGLTPGARRVLVAAGLAVTLPVIGMLAATAVGTMFRATATGTEALEQLPAALTVTTDAGDVHVRAATDGRPRVTWTSHYTFHEPVVTVRRDGDRLTVDTDCSGFQLFGCSVDLEVLVPATIDLTAKSSAGDVSVTGITGHVVVESTAGDVSADDVTGTLDASTSAGDVNARRLQVSTASVRSTAGDVRAAFATAPDQVTARSSAGDVRVVLPTGERLYVVKADTSAGDASVGVKTSSESRYTVDAHSSAGDVSVDYAG